MYILVAKCQEAQKNNLYSLPVLRGTRQKIRAITRQVCAQIANNFSPERLFLSNKD
jgi:hypothetical protein